MTRTTLVALGILVALGAYIYWFERGPLPEDASGELLFDVAAQDVDRLEIRPREGDAVVLSRRDGRFWLVEPVEAQASTDEVDRLIENLETIRFARRVATLEEAANAEAYGLEPPALEVRFWTVDGSERGVAFGADTPTGSNQYLRRLGDDAVLVAASYPSSSFHVTPWDLRDKTVFEPVEDPDRGIARLVIERAGEATIVLVAEDGIFRLTEPFRARAERYEAAELVSSLRELEMQSIVSESFEAGALAEHGLAPPAYRILAHPSREDPAELELHVGNASSSEYYARTPSRPQLFLVDGSFVAALAKPPAELVSRRLFHFSTPDVARLRIAAEDAAERVIEKRREEGDVLWRESAPEPREVPADLVEDLLYRLSGASAGEIATSPSVSREDARLRIAVETTRADGTEEGGEERIAVVAPVPEGDDRDETVYVFRNDEDVALALEASTWREIDSLLPLETDPAPP